MDWDSIPRTGLLVKPAGYDKLRSYPTIVNFYERSSDELHDHRTPAPHRSTINYAFYASRGYVIFNPDISYTTGYPGESAYKIVMSGVTSLFKDRIADPNHIGLQGHSWGGYQVAYITARTNIFTCAEAGAPVVNMTSAYGGVRWESGMSRIFQYEKQQSRIGKTLWEDRKAYLDNSPLFTLDKVETPLLIMHNDEDGAVPWEQGIEYYMALRRLGKTAWLLNYRGEPHWPLKWHLRKDFQLRMSQFFDHYLMDKPMPDWMEDGIPALQRGINAGYGTDTD
jgi:dipeptidyl aminopeptidase/acylaminoacyl peptidase